MGRVKSTKVGANKKASPQNRLKKNLKIKKRKTKASPLVHKSKKNKVLKAKVRAKLIAKAKVEPKAKKAVSSKKIEVSKIESDILLTTSESKIAKKASKRATPKDMLEQIMFRLPFVPEPLIGTPKQVQTELDMLAKKMQREPNDNKIFDKIHLYMHGYLINVVLKKFPFIRGLQTVDIYQETLIALRFKAIPNFKCGKGMSFLNFAKMCIRRHLITLLNASKNRKKDQSINRAISLDSSPLSNDNSDEDGRNTYANIITDDKISVDQEMENNEAYDVTKDTLLNALSEFEQIVLNEYLSSSSYREISKNISVKADKRHNTKSIDNALLRIRKKAMQLKKYSRFEDLPIFLPKKQQ